MNSSERNLSATETLVLEELRAFNATKHITVALSGGMDSKVLLNICWRLRELGFVSHVSALHVDHGLQPHSQDWRMQCLQDCEFYRIPFSYETLNLAPQASANVEALARDARYQVFESYLNTANSEPTGDSHYLLLAHHEDDQAETLLFRLIRGCGIAGAAAMPVQRKLGDGFLLRPLLKVTKRQIEEYAIANHLQWIEDPSNNSEAFSRNYLRHQVMTKLTAKWPSVAHSFARFASVAREQNELLKALAEEDSQLVLTPHGELLVEHLLKLSRVRQRNLLHQWGASHLAFAPTNNEVNQVIKQLPAALEGAQINIDFSSGRIRSYLGRLVLTQKHEPSNDFDSQQWLDFKVPLRLANGIELFASVQSAPGLRLPKVHEVVSVGARKGGERVCPDYRTKTTSLKKVYQELAVPPWQREWLPIVFYNDQIVAVPGVFVEKRYLCSDSEKALDIRLRKATD
ncbi:tRNA lysidine(34) synthetase TilS [Aliikangiella marina]|uniref:tRNA(Ile)-lysidine synthase n=1 Tax=Aliikangiella marina TaxID=1712262 RepID=A0A545TGX0_9GAMM|nr:tRNA lysidine(34) synthetase TilS [Aliikangiella marina]TQV76482.1 tRNA lysidine(34) synthetase TilS [Aliikangiella marina]